MITVKDRVSARVEESPFVRQALSEGLINVSALARQMHSQVRDDLGKNVTIDAVFMALKRYAAELESSSSDQHFELGIGDLTLRTDLFQFTIANSERLMT